MKSGMNAKIIFIFCLLILSPCHGQDARDGKTTEGAIFNNLVTRREVNQPISRLLCGLESHNDDLWSDLAKLTSLPPEIPAVGGPSVGIGGPIAKLRVRSSTDKDTVYEVHLFGLGSNLIRILKRTLERATMEVREIDLGRFRDEKVYKKCDGEIDEALKVILRDSK